MSSSEPDGVRYREYLEQDFLRLCELDRMCFSEEVAYAPEEIAAALVQPETFAVIAEYGGQAVGFCLAGQRRQRVGHIITIDIHPDFRRRGIGARLMGMGERRLAARGAGRVVLEVSVENESAIAFYRERGFSIQRTLPRYYRNGSDAYLMEKML